MSKEKTFVIFIMPYGLILQYNYHLNKNVYLHLNSVALNLLSVNQE